MSDRIKITVEVNGKQVPLSSLSEETINKIWASEEEENAPVFFRARDRLCMRITPELIDEMRTQGILGITDPRYVSFTPDGLIGSNHMGFTYRNARSYYLIPPEPIFLND